MRLAPVPRTTEPCDIPTMPPTSGAIGVSWAAAPRSTVPASTRTWSIPLIWTRLCSIWATMSPRASSEAGSESALRWTVAVPPSTTTPRPARSALRGMRLEAPFASQSEGPASSPETRESACELRGYQRSSGTNLDRSRDRKARELTAKFCMSRDKGSRMP